MTARFYNENTARFTKNTAPFYNDPRFLPFIGLLLEIGDICEIPFNKCVRGHRPIISAAIKMWKIRWKHFFLNLVEETGWRIWRQHQLLDLRKSFRTVLLSTKGGHFPKWLPLCRAQRISVWIFASKIQFLGLSTEYMSNLVIQMSERCWF